jgi:predicted lipoprotein with Yx(FWY)xxD motif
MDVVTMERTPRVVTALALLAASLLAAGALMHNRGASAGTGPTDRPGSGPAGSGQAGRGSAAGAAGPIAGAGVAGAASHSVGLIMAMPTTIGTVVTDDYMHTLYRFDGDSAAPSRSTCTDACTKDWLPVRADGRVTFPGGDRSLVGNMTRADGMKQLTLKGWPLYRYVGDQAEGDTKGQGVGGAWSAVAPDGTRVGRG